MSCRARIRYAKGRQLESPPAPATGLTGAVQVRQEPCGRNQDWLHPALLGAGQSGLKDAGYHPY